ncbi:MAG: ferritin family protein [Candidatus Paceibacterota bacterium]
MFSITPIDTTKIDEKDLEKQLLRIGLMAELDAINLYEQLAALSKDEIIKQTFKNIAGEEKEHIGELETLLLRHDPEQIKELKEGTTEVEELDK